MVAELPEDPARQFIKTLLVNNWNPNNVNGFDVNASEGTEAFLPVDESFEKTKPPHPLIYIQNSGSESVSGESGYSFISASGPGQNRDGSLTVQIHAEDKDGAYNGDSANFSDIEARDLVRELRQEVERITIDNATGGVSEFSHVSSFRNEVPDERDDTTVVRKAGCSVGYSWLRDP